MEQDRENIDESTIMEQTGVKTENVKKLFKEKMNGETVTVRTSRKKGKKKTIFVLAAAIVATLALGTVGAGAAGSFDAVFGERFAGERVNGVYSGANVSVTSSDSYNTEFLGICGDHHNTMAAIKITKADGTGFAVPEDAKYTYVTPFCFGLVFDGDAEKLNKALSITEDDTIYSGKVEVTRSLWNQITNGGKTYSATEGGGPEFILEDAQTLKCIEYYCGSQYELVGETMSMEEPIVYLYHVKRDVMECRLDEGYNAIGLMSEESAKAREEYSTPASEEIAKKLTEIRKGLKENEYLVVNSERFTSEGKMTFCVAEIAAEKINLSGSWKLNYKAENIRKLHVRENEFTLEGEANGHDLSEVKIHVTSLEADTFTTAITMQFDGNILNYDTTDYSGLDSNKWYEKFFSFGAENIFVTLENGEKVAAMLDVSNVNYGADGGSCAGQLVYLKGNHSITLPVSEIVSITINGVELI